MGGRGWRRSPHKQQSLGCIASQAVTKIREQEALCQHDADFIQISLFKGCWLLFFVSQIIVLGLTGMFEIIFKCLWLVCDLIRLA